MAETTYLKAATFFRYAPTLCSQDGVGGCTCSKSSNGVLSHVSKKTLSHLGPTTLSSPQNLNRLASDAPQHTSLTGASCTHEVEQDG